LAFIQYLKSNHIEIHRPETSKEDVLSFLAVKAEESGVGISREILSSKLFERENTMSTGIGNAVGVPHTLVEGIQGLHAFVLTLQQPIPYDSVDGKPVCVIFGLFGDPDSPRLSLGALATLGRILREEDFVLSLWNAKSPEVVYQLLEEKEFKRDS